MGDLYSWLKVLHILGVVAWMAALLYLPRLLVYHAGVAPGSEASETFKVMERRLLKAIAAPSMIVVWVAGLLLAWRGGWFTDGWLHAKILLVLAMSAFHGMTAKWVRGFAADANTRSARFYRIANEVPTVLLILIVVLVVVKPF